MAFCAFDEGVAGFDVTPVENMFISEYMLGAPGEYVKVYLYGLMLCYHDQARMSLTSMARDLKATEEEIERAFRYWERNGLVRRVGDNPVCYAYKSIKQLALTRAQDPAEKLYNRAFAEEARRILGDRLTEASDYNRIYDWMDVYEFPEDVVLMLLRYEMQKSKGRFSFKIADRTAKEWAHRGVRSVEDAEKIVLIDDVRAKALRRLIASLGQAGMPSDDQKEMYNKWMDEWGFTAEAIEEARKQTANAPTMGYLNGILRKLHEQNKHTEWEVKQSIRQSDDAHDFSGRVLDGLGRAGVVPTQEDKACIAGWVRDGFTQEIILMAVTEVHARGGSNLEDVDAKLAMWKKQGFTTPEQIGAARMRVKALNEQLREVYAAAGIEKRVNELDRDLLTRWMGKWKMPMELVLLAAEYARGAGAPMKIADRILSDWQRAGIASVDAARAEHEAHMRMGGGAKPASAAQDAMLRYTPQERRATYAAAVVDLDEEVQ